MKFCVMKGFADDLLRFIRTYVRFLKKNGQDEYFSEIRKALLLDDRKNDILRFYEKHPAYASKYTHEIECLEKNIPYKMTCDVADFRNKKAEIAEQIENAVFDYEAGMYYVLRNSKRLYFKRSINSIDKLKDYYEYLSYEQTENSPHRYLDDDFQIDEGSVVVDCGAAEGFFGLDNIDKIKLLYIFECDEEWIEALKYTFKPYENKVQIISKYVGAEDNESMVTIDTFFEGKRVDFIKMDIEGYEVDVLSGAEKLLSSDEPLKIATAAYHSKDAEKKIIDKLPNFIVKKSKGFLLHAWETAEPPYFRTGIIRAEKEYIKNDKK